MCGIIGYVPKNKNSMPNLDWVKLIMSYNATRGTDSCGIYINGQVLKGVDNQADIRIFIARNKLSMDLNAKNKNIIAHARKSSYGKNTLSNCHPFRIEHEGKVMYLIHNGTITNIHAMAKKYEIDTKDLNVDSEILGNIILKRGYDVLNEYEGGAALMWFFEHEPNTLYVFKGASKPSYHKEQEEERPLYFIKNEDGYYFSSLREPLDACSNQDITVYTITENMVCKIKSNHMENIFTADRSKINSFIMGKTITNTTATQTLIGCGTNCEILDRVKLSSPEEIYYEVGFSYTNPEKVFNNSVSFLCGRYFVNKELTFIKLDATAENEKYLLNGWHRISFYKNSETPAIISTSDSAPLFYFYQGILIKADKVQPMINKMKKRFDVMTNKFERLRQLSSYSKYPITFLQSEVVNLQKPYHPFYHNGKVVSNHLDYNPLFSYRTYSFDKHGYISKIETINKYDTTMILIPDDDLDTDTEHYTFLEIGEDIVLKRFKFPNVIDELAEVKKEELSGINPDTLYQVLGNSDVWINGDDVINDIIDVFMTDYFPNLVDTQEEYNKWRDDFYNYSKYNLKEALSRYSQHFDYEIELYNVLLNMVVEIEEELTNENKSNQTSSNV